MPSHTDWEASVQQLTIVRLGSTVFISGTTSRDSAGNLVGIGDAYLQSLQALRNLEIALHEVGATFKNITSARIQIASLNNSVQVEQAIRTFFKEATPVFTIVQTNDPANPEVLVSIEADAKLSA